MTDLMEEYTKRDQVRTELIKEICKLDFEDMLRVYHLGTSGCSSFNDYVQTMLQFREETIRAVRAAGGLKKMRETSVPLTDYLEILKGE